MSRTVVVTGAASGNGHAIATRFLERGDRVAAIDISQDGLDAVLASDWKPHRERVVAIEADVAREKDVDDAFGRALDVFGRIDVLVNNAGITGGPQATTLHETPVEAFDNVFAVNVRGVFLGCRAALPGMLERGAGVILNIASVAGLVAFPGRAAYTASKGAVVQLTRSITADYARHGIRCTALCPGMIETPMTKWRLDQPELRAQMEALVPDGTIGTVADVSSAVWFLASDDARYFNGCAVVMDGGMTAV
jgi:NAD(P)-dependent dehydrogenase (short-subunit alcohol dehydrogenase family)